MRDDLHYDLEMKEEPFCQVIVDFRSPVDAESFVAVVRSFAHDLDLIERAQARPPFPSPMHILPNFLGPDMLLSAFYILHQDGSYGQTRLSQLRRDTQRSTFRRQAQTFASRFHNVFSSQARICDNSTSTNGTASDV